MHGFSNIITFLENLKFLYSDCRGCNGTGVSLKFCSIPQSVAILCSNSGNSVVNGAYFTNRYSAITTQNTFWNCFNVALWVLSWTGNQLLYASLPREYNETKNCTLCLIVSLENFDAVRPSITTPFMYLPLDFLIIQWGIIFMVTIHTSWQLYRNSLNWLNSIFRGMQVLLRNIPENTIVFFSDKAYFDLSGSVNKQNSDTNPRELHETPSY